MENVKEKAKTGIIAILLMLAGFGGSQVLTPDQVDNAYICPLNDNIGVFHRLSTSGKTGYYYDGDNNEVRASCRSGRTYEAWISLKQYAEDKGVNLIEPEQEQAQRMTSKIINCNPDGCVEVN